ncbi:hypothetical protein C0995_011698 [Termitomyces sp. Mi166|nr:hypothetical protein C0995_011698 [Termitomyces sp. Mi166\
MSKLAQDAAAFKSVLKRQDYTSWHSQPPALSEVSTPASPEAESSSQPTPKKKRPKTNIVYSQPADTGTGLNVNTQLVYAVNHLKGTQNPMRLQDIAIVTNTPLDTDPVLLEKFKGHDRIIWDPKTDLYSYKAQIQRQTRKGGGIPVRALKESWKEAPAAIEELEKEGEVLVTRTVKDGQLRMVFWNEIKPTEEAGGMPVEKDGFFDGRRMLHIVKIHADVVYSQLLVTRGLLKQVGTEGLQVTNAEAPVPKAPAGKKKGKRGGAPRQRQVRITNTHMKGEIDLSRDYVAPARQK